eukprot:7308966-Pyramimonas_sp.AAC.1
MLLSSSVEISRRIQATAESYYALGQIWPLELPFRWKQTMFLSFAQNAALTGLEPMLLTKRQYRELDSLLARYGRRALQGKATTKVDGKTRS